MAVKTSKRVNESKAVEPALPPSWNKFTDKLPASAQGVVVDEASARAYFEQLFVKRRGDTLAEDERKWTFTCEFFWPRLRQEVEENRAASNQESIAYKMIQQDMATRQLLENNRQQFEDARWAEIYAGTFNGTSQEMPTMNCQEVEYEEVESRPKKTVMGLVKDGVRHIERKHQEAVHEQETNPVNIMKNRLNLLGMWFPGLAAFRYQFYALGGVALAAVVGTGLIFNWVVALIVHAFATVGISELLTMWASEDEDAA